MTTRAGVIAGRPRSEKRISGNFCERRQTLRMKGTAMARHVPTPEQRSNVLVLTGLGASPEMLAGLLKIEVDTLKDAYKKELAAGPETVRIEAMKQLFNAAKTADGPGRVTAAVKLLDLLSAEDSADKAENGFKPNLNEPPQREMFFLEGCNEPVELFTADDKPAPALYYRQPKATKCHPGDTACTRNDNCEYHDPRGYKLFQLYPRKHYDIRLFDKDGHPYEPVAMCWGDQWV
jgi:hypothetical protein